MFWNHAVESSRHRRFRKRNSGENQSSRNTRRDEPCFLGPYKGFNTISTESFAVDLSSELLGFAALPGIMGISDRPVRIGRPAGAGRFGPLPNTSNSAKQDRPQAKNKFSNGKENFSSKSLLTRKRRLLLPRWRRKLLDKRSLSWVHGWTTVLNSF